MNPLRVTLERRTLLVLMVLAGAYLLLHAGARAVVALGGMESPLAPGVLFALAGVASVGVLAAMASYAAVSPQRTLAWVGFGITLGISALGQVVPLIEVLHGEARDAFFDLFPVVSSVLYAVAGACMLGAMALSSSGGARTAGLALAALALALPIVVIALPRELAASAWGIGLEVLMDLTPIAAYALRRRALGGVSIDEQPAGAPLAGREDWQVAATGAGTLRAAVVLQIVVVSGVFALGLIGALGRGGGGAGLALIVMILGLLGAIAVVVLYVVGLSRLGRMPWVSRGAHRSRPRST